MGFERARAGRRVVEKATRDRVNHSFAATPRCVPSLLPLTRHSDDMLLQSDVDGVGMCVRQAPGRKVLTVAMVLPPSVGPLFPGGCLPARVSVQRCMYVICVQFPLLLREFVAERKPADIRRGRVSCFRGGKGGASAVVRVGVQARDRG